MSIWKSRRRSKMKILIWKLSVYRLLYESVLYFWVWVLPQKFTPLFKCREDSPNATQVKYPQTLIVDILSLSGPVFPSFPISKFTRSVSHPLQSLIYSFEFTSRLTLFYKVQSHWDYNFEWKNKQTNKITVPFPLTMQKPKKPVKLIANV